MDAKKCDRCGEFYTEQATYPVVTITRGKTRQVNDIGNSLYSMDLCPECWKSFGEWWGKTNDRSK